MLNSVFETVQAHVHLGVSIVPPGWLLSHPRTIAAPTPKLRCDGQVLPTKRVQDKTAASRALSMTLDDIGPLLIPAIEILLYKGRAKVIAILSSVFFKFRQSCSFPSEAMASSNSVPSSVLIIGSGVFGLSTAWSLCKNPLFKDTEIALVDRQPFPASDSSSVRTQTFVNVSLCPSALYP